MHDYINEPTNYICPFLKAYNIGDKYTEWQNVKYKLPVANQYVLIYVKEKNYYTMVTWTYGTITYQPEGIWFSEDKWYYNQYRIEYWMPIPKIPEEK